MTVSEGDHTGDVKISGRSYYETLLVIILIFNSVTFYDISKIAPKDVSSFLRKIVKIMVFFRVP